MKFQNTSLTLTNFLFNRVQNGDKRGGLCQRCLDSVKYLNCNKQEFIQRVPYKSLSCQDVKKCTEPQMARKCPELPNLKKFDLKLFWDTLYKGEA